MDRSYFCHSNSPAVQGWLNDPALLAKWLEMGSSGNDFYIEKPDIGGSLPTPEELADLRPSETARQLFHYTDIYDLPRFLYSGLIDVWPDFSWPQRTWVAWFSRNPTWERDSALSDGRMSITAGGSIGTSPRFEYLAEAARIRVRPESVPYRWDRYLLWCDVPPSVVWLRGDSVARKKGANADDWYVSPWPVPASEWLSVEVWDGAALKWIPITESTDAQIRELLPLLPAHLLPRDDGFRHEDAFRHLHDPSPGKLSNIPAALNALRLPISPPYGDKGDFEAIIDEFKLARERWLHVSSLAREGFSVVPLDNTMNIAAHNGIGSATRQQDAINRWWLGEHCLANVGVLLPHQPAPVFAIRMNDATYNRLQERYGRLPVTMSFAEFDTTRPIDPARCVLPDNMAFIFKSYPGIHVPASKTEIGIGCVIETVPAGTVYVGSGHYRDRKIYTGAEKKIAKAPPWLLALLRKSDRRAERNGRL